MNYKLDDDEREILESIERGEWKSVPNVKEKFKNIRAMLKHQLIKIKE